MSGTAGSGQLSLQDLANDCPALTEAAARYLAEAAVVCLDYHRHPSPVELLVEGVSTTSYMLEWFGLDDAISRCHNDLVLATEYDAYAIAILTVRRVSGLRAVSRARRGTGIDYWLGEEDEQSLRFTAGLEVSGILSGDRVRVASRARQKFRQASRAASEFPVYVAVVEFQTQKVEVSLR